MIDAELLREDAILVVSPEGALQKADFDRLRLLVDPYIEKNGPLNGLMIYVKSFPGWEDFSSMLSHFRFIDDHQHKIKRVAAVTENAFLSILPRVSDHFVDAEVRHFHYEDHQAAMAWLKTGEEPVQSGHG